MYTQEQQQNISDHPCRLMMAHLLHLLLVASLFSCGVATADGITNHTMLRFYLNDANHSLVLDRTAAGSGGGSAGNASQLPNHTVFEVHLCSSATMQDGESFPPSRWCSENATDLSFTIPEGTTVGFGSTLVLVAPPPPPPPPNSTTNYTEHAYPSCSYRGLHVNLRGITFTGANTIVLRSYEAMRPPLNTSSSSSPPFKDNNNYTSTGGVFCNMTLLLDSTTGAPADVVLEGGGGSLVFCRKTLILAYQAALGAFIALVAPTTYDYHEGSVRAAAGSVTLTEGSRISIDSSTLSRPQYLSYAWGLLMLLFDGSGGGSMYDVAVHPPWNETSILFVAPLISIGASSSLDVFDSSSSQGGGFWFEAARLAVTGGSTLSFSSSSIVAAPTTNNSTSSTAPPPKPTFGIIVRLVMPIIPRDAFITPLHRVDTSRGHNDSGNMTSLLGLAIDNKSVFLISSVTIRLHLDDDGSAAPSSSSSLRPYAGYAVFVELDDTTDRGVYISHYSSWHLYFISASVHIIPSNNRSTTIMPPVAPAAICVGLSRSTRAVFEVHDNAQWLFDFPTVETTHAGQLNASATPTIAVSRTTVASVLVAAEQARDMLVRVSGSSSISIVYGAITVGNVHATQIAAAFALDFGQAISARMEVLDDSHALHITDYSSLECTAADSTTFGSSACVGVLLRLAFTTNFSILVANSSSLLVADLSSTATGVRAGMDIAYDHAHDAVISVENNSAAFGAQGGAQLVGTLFTGVNLNFGYTQRMSLVVDMRSSIGFAEETGSLLSGVLGLVFSATESLMFAFTLRDGSVLGARNGGSISGSYNSAMVIQLSSSQWLTWVIEGDGSVVGASGANSVIRATTENDDVLFAIRNTTDSIVSIRGVDAGLGVSGGAAMRSDVNTASTYQYFSLRFYGTDSTNVSLVVSGGGFVGARRGSSIHREFGHGILIEFDHSIGVRLVVAEDSSIGAAYGSTILSLLRLVSFSCTWCRDVSVSLSHSSAFGVTRGSQGISLLVGVIFSIVNATRIAITIANHSTIGVSDRSAMLGFDLEPQFPIAVTLEGSSHAHVLLANGSVIGAARASNLTSTKGAQPSGMIRVDVQRTTNVTILLCSGAAAAGCDAPSPSSSPPLPTAPTPWTRSVVGVSNLPKDNASVEGPSFIVSSNNVNGVAVQLLASRSDGLRFILADGCVLGAVGPHIVAVHHSFFVRLVASDASFTSVSVRGVGSLIGAELQPSVSTGGVPARLSASYMIDIQFIACRFVKWTTSESAIIGLTSTSTTTMNASPAADVNITTLSTNNDGISPPTAVVGALYSLRVHDCSHVWWTVASGACEGLCDAHHHGEEDNCTVPRLSFQILLAVSVKNASDIGLTVRGLRTTFGVRDAGGCPPSVSGTSTGVIAQWEGSRNVSIVVEDTAVVGYNGYTTVEVAKPLIWEMAGVVNKSMTIRGGAVLGVANNATIVIPFERTGNARLVSVTCSGCAHLSLQVADPGSTIGFSNGSIGRGNRLGSSGVLLGLYQGGGGNVVAVANHAVVGVQGQSRLYYATAVNLEIAMSEPLTSNVGGTDSDPSLWATSSTNVSCSVTIHDNAVVGATGVGTVVAACLVRVYVKTSLLGAAVPPPFNVSEEASVFASFSDALTTTPDNESYNRMPSTVLFQILDGGVVGMVDGVEVGFLDDDDHSAGGGSAADAALINFWVASAQPDVVDRRNLSVQRYPIGGCLLTTLITVDGDGSFIGVRRARIVDGEMAVWAPPPPPSRNTSLFNLVATVPPERLLYTSIVETVGVAFLLRHEAAMGAFGCTGANQSSSAVVLQNPLQEPIRVTSNAVEVMIGSSAFVLFAVVTGASVGCGDGMSLRRSDPPSPGGGTATTHTSVVSLFIAGATLTRYYVNCARVGLMRNSTSIEGIALTAVMVAAETRQATFLITNRSFFGVFDNSSAHDGAVVLSFKNSADGLAEISAGSIVGVGPHSMCASSASGSPVSLELTSSNRSRMVLDGPGTVVGLRGPNAQGIARGPFTAGAARIIISNEPDGGAPSENCSVVLMDGALFGAVDNATLHDVNGVGLRLAFLDCMDCRLTLSRHAMIGADRGSTLKGGAGGLIIGFDLAIVPSKSNITTTSSADGCVSPLSEGGGGGIDDTLATIVVSHGSFIGAREESVIDAPVNVFEIRAKGPIASSMLRVLVTMGSTIGVSGGSRLMNGVLLLWAQSASTSSSTSSWCSSWVVVTDRSGIGARGVNSSLLAVQLLLNDDGNGGGGALLLVTNHSVVGVWGGGAFHKNDGGGKDYDCLLISMQSSQSAKLLVMNGSLLGAEVLSSVEAMERAFPMYVNIRVVFDHSVSFNCHVSMRSHIGFLQTGAPSRTEVVGSPSSSFANTSSIARSSMAVGLKAVNVSSSNITIAETSSIGFRLNTTTTEEENDVTLYLRCFLRPLELATFVVLLSIAYSADSRVAVTSGSVVGVAPGSIIWATSRASSNNYNDSLGVWVTMRRAHRSSLLVDGHGSAIGIVASTTVPVTGRPAYVVYVRPVHATEEPPPDAVIIINTSQGYASVVQIEAAESVDSTVDISSGGLVGVAAVEHTYPTTMLPPEEMLAASSWEASISCFGHLVTAIDGVNSTRLAISASANAPSWSPTERDITPPSEQHTWVAFAGLRGGGGLERRGRGDLVDPPGAALHWQPRGTLRLRAPTAIALLDISTCTAAKLALTDEGSFFGLTSTTSVWTNDNNNRTSTMVVGVRIEIATHAPSQRALQNSGGLMRLLEESQPPLRSPAAVRAIELRGGTTLSVMRGGRIGVVSSSSGRRSNASSIPSAISVGYLAPQSVGLLALVWGNAAVLNHTNATSDPPGGIFLDGNSSFVGVTGVCVGLSFCSTAHPHTLLDSTADQEEFTLESIVSIYLLGMIPSNPEMLPAEGQAETAAIIMTISNGSNVRVCDSMLGNVSMPPSSHHLSMLRISADTQMNEGEGGTPVQLHCIAAAESETHEEAPSSSSPPRSCLLVAWNRVVPTAAEDNNPVQVLRSLRIVDAALALPFFSAGTDVLLLSTFCNFITGALLPVPWYYWLPSRLPIIAGVHPNVTAIMSVRNTPECALTSTPSLSWRPGVPLSDTDTSTVSVPMSPTKTGGVGTETASADHSVSDGPTATESLRPPPPTPPPLRVPDALLRSSETASMLLSVVAPQSVLGGRRATVLALLGQCSSSELPTADTVLSDDDTVFLDDPLKLRLGRQRGAAARGTVVGNLVLLLACIAVGFAMTMAVYRCASSARRRRCSSVPKPSTAQMIITNAAKLRLPGMFFIVVSLFLQPLVSASVLLVGYGDGGVDSAIGGLGLCVVGTLVAAMGRVLDPRRGSFRAVAERGRDDDDDDLGVIRRRAALRAKWGASVLRAEALWRWLHAASFRWRSRDEVADRLFVDRYGFLFESCSDGRQWWLTWEVLATVIVGVLGGLVPGSEEACRGIAWFALALSVLALVACIVVRPMNSPMETAVVVLLWGAQAAMAVCGVAGGAEEVAEDLGIVASVLSALLAALMVLAVLGARVERIRREGLRKVLRDMIHDTRIMGPAPSHCVLLQHPSLQQLEVAPPPPEMRNEPQQDGDTQTAAADARLPLLAELVALICQGRHRHHQHAAVRRVHQVRRHQTPHDSKRRK